MTDALTSVHQPGHQSLIPLQQPGNRRGFRLTRLLAEADQRVMVGPHCRQMRTRRIGSIPHQPASQIDQVSRYGSAWQGHGVDGAAGCGRRQGGGC